MLVCDSVMVMVGVLVLGSINELGSTGKSPSGLSSSAWKKSMAVGMFIMIHNHRSRCRGIIGLYIMPVKTTAAVHNGLLFQFFGLRESPQIMKTSK